MSDNNQNEAAEPVVEAQETAEEAQSTGTCFLRFVKLARHAHVCLAAPGHSFSRALGCSSC